MNRYVIAVCVVSLAVVGISKADVPDEKKAAPAAPGQRLDQQGNPLPVGAIARLGTVPNPSNIAQIALIAVAPDGKTASTFCREGTARLWDARTGAEMRLIMRTRDDPRGIAFAAGGKHLVTVTYSHRRNEDDVRVWEVATGKELRHFSREAFFGLSEDGEILATQPVNSGVTLWQTATGEQIKSRIGLPAANETNPFGPQVTGERKEDWYGNNLVLSPDGKYLAWYVQRTARGVARLQVWEAASGKKLFESKLASASKDQTSAILGGFSADSSKLLLGGDGRVWILDVHTGKTSRRIALNDNPQSIALSPNGKWVVVAEGTGPIRVLDVEADKEGWLKGHQFGAHVFAFSADSKTLFSGEDTTVLVWDLTTVRWSNAGASLWWVSVVGLVLIALVVLWRLVAFLGSRRLRST